MERKLKAGIIGCGGIAFSKHMPGFAKLDSVEIAGFYNPSIDKAIRAKQEFGCEDSKVYSTYQDMFKESQIDVVHICTPNKYHSEIAIEALKSGKHVMCEKPMAINAAEAEKMVKAAKMSGKKLSISFQNRFRNDSIYLKKVCERGDLGEIYFAKAHAVRRRGVPTWGAFLNREVQGGGPLIDIGVHALDLTLWLMNNYKVKYVVGNTYNKLAKRYNEANAWGPWDPEKFTVEDSAFGFITMENGATITLECSWALNTLDEGAAKTTLCGTEGGADMRNGLRINGVEFSKMYTKAPVIDPSGVDYYEGKKESAGDREMRMWIESILNDTEPVVKAEEALVVTKIIDAIYESSQTGKPVYFGT